MKILWYSPGGLINFFIIDSELFRISFTHLSIYADLVGKHFHHVKPVLPVYEYPHRGLELFYLAGGRISDGGIKLPGCRENLNDAHIAVTDIDAIFLINCNALGPEKFSFFDAPAADEIDKQPFGVQHLNPGVDHIDDVKVMLLVQGDQKGIPEGPFAGARRTV